MFSIGGNEICRKYGRVQKGRAFEIRKLINWIELVNSQQFEFVAKQKFDGIAAKTLRRENRLLNKRKFRKFTFFHMVKDLIFSFGKWNFSFIKKNRLLSLFESSFPLRKLFHYKSENSLARKIEKWEFDSR